MVTPFVESLETDPQNNSEHFPPDTKHIIQLEIHTFAGIHGIDEWIQTVR